MHVCECPGHLHSRHDHAAFSLSLALPAMLQAYSADPTISIPTGGLVGGAAAVDNDAVTAVVFSELRQRLVSDGQRSVEHVEITSSNVSAGRQNVTLRPFASYF